MMHKIAVFLITVFTVTGAMAHSGVTNEDVMKRMMVMSAMGANLQKIGLMLRQKQTFDAPQARLIFEDLQALAAKTPVVFKAPASDPKSEADPRIWQEFANFVALSDKLVVAAGHAAQQVKTVDDLRPALAAIGQTCKACHSQYRN